MKDDRKKLNVNHNGGKEKRRNDPGIHVHHQRQRQEDLLQQQRTLQGISLSSLLSWGLINHPEVMDDLLAICSALDSGECVNIVNISNPEHRSFFLELASYLPVEEMSNGFMKRSNVLTVSGYLLKQMLYAGAIKQPLDLSVAERMSCQSAPSLLVQMVAKDRALIKDLPPFLRRILKGRSVSVRDYVGEQSYHGICGFLSSLQVERKRSSAGAYDSDDSQSDNGSDSDGGAVFALPDKSSASGRHDMARSIIESYLEIFLQADAVAEAKRTKLEHGDDSKDSSHTRIVIGDSGFIAAGKNVKSKKLTRERSYSQASESTRSSSSSPSASSTSGSAKGSGHRSRRYLSHRSGTADGEGSDGFDGKQSQLETNKGNERRGAVVVGPALPTAEELEHFAARGALQTTVGNDDSDDDEDHGPQVYQPDPADTRHWQRREAVLPLGFTGKEEDAVFATTSISTSSSLSAPASASAVARFGGAKEGGDEGVTEGKVELYREEWILAPGDSRAFSDLMDNHPSALKNRKFNTGKQAKKLAEEMSAHREQIVKAAALAAASSASAGVAGSGAGVGEVPMSEADQLVEEYKKKRGPSLMDAHMAAKNNNSSSNNMNKRPKYGGDGGSSSGGGMGRGSSRGRSSGMDGEVEYDVGLGGIGTERQAFDYERDMTSHRRMDKNQLQKLVENAKELDSRFNKAATQKSFL